jgi:hypothetical protein
MAGPWEQFSKDEAAVKKPWEQYGSATPEAVVEEPAQTTEQPESSGYLVDQIKKRYGEYASLMQRYGAAQFGGMIAEMGGADPEVLEELKRVSGEDNSEQLAKSLFGYKGIEPTSDTERYKGVAAAAAADPLNLVFIPGAFARNVVAGMSPTLFQTTKPYLAALLEWGAGTGAEVAGYGAAEATQKVFEGTGLENSTVDHIARFAASLTAGVSVGAGTSAVVGTASGVGAAGGVFKETDAVTDVLSNASIKALLDSAAVSGGTSFQKQIDDVFALQKQYPDLVLPLVAGVGKNPVIEKEFLHLYKTNPEFRSQFDEKVVAVKEQFDLARTSLAERVPQSQLESIVSESNKQLDEARAVFDANLQQLEVARDTVVQRYREGPDSSKVVQAADNLAKEAETRARAAASIEYNKAFDYLKDNGIDTVPESTVQAMWNKMRIVVDSRVFQDHPSVQAKIKSIWAPEVVDGTMKFNEVPIAQLDSLKQEINRVMRTTNPADRGKISELMALKEELDLQIFNIDPQFSQLYKAADAAYLQKVGLPFSADGYRAFDAAKLDVTAARHLTRPDQIRDYLAIAGPAGEQVVKDAFMLRALQEMRQGGDINPEKLRSFILRNEAALNEVPNVKAMFQADEATIERLLRTEANLNSNFNAFALEKTDGFFKAIGARNLDSVSGDVLNSFEKRKQYMKQINDMTPESKHIAITGLKQGMLNKAASYPDKTMYEFIQDNRDAFDEVFGKGFGDNVKSLSTLFEMTRFVDYVQGQGMAISGTRETAFKKLMGISVEETVGTLRNQVMSGWRKFMHLGAKSYVTKTQEKVDKALIDIFLDANNLEEIAKEAAKASEQLRSMNSDRAKTAMKDFGVKLGKTIGSHITKGSVRGVAGGSMFDAEDFNGPMLPTQQEDDELFPFRRR